MSSPLILSIGLDSSLLDNRALLFQSAGYLVMSALSLKEGVEHFQTTDFDLIVLCRSIPAKDRERLACLIRASGSFIPVVSIEEDGCQQDVFPDATLDERNSNAFVARIHKILTRTVKRPRARGIRPGNLETSTL